MKQWILGALCLYACSSPLSVNKEKQLSKLRKAQQQETRWQHSTVLSAHDSQGYELLFYPKDSSHFDLNRGFRGKAEKIYWRGSQENLAWQKENAQKELSSNTNVQQLINTRHKEKQGTTLAIPKLYLGLGLTLIILIIYYMYKRKKKILW